MSYTGAKKTSYTGAMRRVILEQREELYWSNEKSYTGAKRTS